MENKTIDNEKLKELYEQSLEKWEKIRNNFRSYFLSFGFFEYCSFCKEQLRKGYEHLDIRGIVGCTTCSIDKFICGSKESLLSKLSNIKLEMDNLVDDIICNLSEHIYILNKDIKNKK